MSDLRFAFRQLAKSPGFTAAAVLTLALGIGATTALYSVVDGVLLRPLVFPDPDRLVSLVERSDETIHRAANYDNFLEWRDGQRSFTAIGAARPWSADVAGGVTSEQFAGAQVTWDYLAAAAVAPVRGRLFGPADDRPEAARTVVLGETLWHRLFAGSDSALGATIRIKGQVYTVIGILPRGFVQPTPDCAFWVPVAPFASDYRGHVPRSPGPFHVLARLQPDVTLDAARRQMETVAQQLATASPATNAGRSVVLARAADQLLGPVRPTLLLLLGATGGVLLIAIANLTSLQLARAGSREGEISIRVALGAGSLRLARLILAENLLLGLLGSAAGVLLAAWALDAVRALLPAQFPRVEEIAINPRVLAFAFATGFAAILVAGSAPLWRVTGVRTIFSAGAAGVGARATRRWHASLLVVQIAVTCVLLVGTGLMARTLFRLHQAALGFDRDQVLSFSWSPSVNEEPARAELVARALDQLAALPGVRSAGLISEMPLGGNYFIRPLSIQGATPDRNDRQPEGASFSVSPDYFATMRMPIVRGRSFTARDNDRRAPLVAIVDTRLVEQHFPGQDPIGQRIKFGTPDDRRPWVEIIGVVEHVENRGLGQTSNVQAYIPYLQRGPPFTMAFMVRSDRDAAALESEVRTLMRQLAPDFPVYSVATMDARFHSSISSQRLAGGLLGGFAFLALLLAAVGLFGVLSYQVGQRTREIGVRIALGANPGAIVRLIVGHGLRPIGIGLAIGAVAAAAITRLLSGLLYQTPPADPATFAVAALLLTIVGLLACWFPARRAIRVNPVEALRAE